VAEIAWTRWPNSHGLGGRNQWNTHYVYTEENLSLDHYLIVEPNDSWQIYNWFQHFTLDAIKTELEAAGFLLDAVAGDLSGELLTAESEFIGIVAWIE